MNCVIWRHEDGDGDSIELVATPSGEIIIYINDEEVCIPIEKVKKLNRVITYWLNETT